MNEQAPKSSGGCGKIAIGCGIAAVIVVIILAAVGWYVYNNARGWVASGGASVVNQAVEQSTLPDEQKQAIISRVDHVKEEFAAGNITLEDFGRAMENLDIESLIMAGMAQYVGADLMNSPQFSDDDRAAGRQALNRVSHGLLEGQIDTQDIEQVLSPIMLNPGSGDWEFKPNPTDKELNQVMDRATDLADQAGVPEDVGEVDFGARVNEAFDKALGTP